MAPWNKSDSGAIARRVLALSRETPQGITRPIIDTGLQSGLSLLNFGFPTFPAFGVIVDSCALTYTYKVQVEKGHPTITAVQLCQTSLGAFGCRQLNTLTPGTGVWLLLHEKSYYGVIIGVQPDPMTQAQRSLVDALSLTTRWRVDEAHRRPLKMVGGGGVTDWTAGRPFDITTGGEAGWITETGLRISLDSFLAQLAVDETTGVFAFYHDQLLRLAGYNLQEWTAGAAREAFDDQGEYDEVRGCTPYPWEAFGAFTPTSQAIRQLKDTETQQETPWYGPWEPSQDTQKPFYRLQEFDGYLGQGGDRRVCAPHQNTAVNLYGDSPPQLAGLAQAHWTLAGRHMLASAKGISLTKRLLLPMPQQLVPPADPTGDTAKNYRPAGIGSAGKAHVVTGDIQTTSAYPVMERLAGLFDLHAYIFNWEATHPFYYHAKDWELPEESKINYVTPQNQVTPAFGSLDSQQWLNAPTPQTVKVDHRYGNVSYYPNTAGLDIMEDGGVCIYDGFGGEIRMGGGSIMISCPGDIWLKPGRNVNAWTGHDVVLRANNSVDVSATSHDVRIKAENNIQVLAGNSGTGGVLIESRAEGPVYDFSQQGEDIVTSGIMLRTPSSDVVAWAANIYLRTGGAAGLEDGVICLDAGQGQDQIIMNCAGLEVFCIAGVQFSFTDGNGNVQAVDQFSQADTIIAGGMTIGGNIACTGGMVLEGNLNLVDGYIGSPLAPQNHFLVGDLTGLSLSLAQQALALVEQNQQQATQSAGSIYQFLADNFYQQNQPGDGTLISQAQFCFRTSAQYRTTQFTLFEDRWQQLSRLANQGGNTWDEVPVTFQSQPTYPHPGAGVIDQKTLLQSNFTMFDPPNGRDKDRTDPAYQQPSYGNFTAVTLLDSYTII
jgi:hypothetical protein